MAHVFLLMLSLTGCTLEGALYLLLCLMTSVALPGEGSSATGAASRFSKPLQQGGARGLRRPGGGHCLAFGGRRL
jgi:hypothetical protein